jgi:hypothetical protein
VGEVLFFVCPKKSTEKKGSWFLGYINILNGWWVLFIYGESGMEEGNDNIVLGREYPVQY